MKIRKTNLSDLPQLIAIFDIARSFMQSTGNKNQWISGYPSEDVIKNDIAKDQSFVIVNDNEIVGTFCFFVGNEPTYDKIYEGTWLNDKPYGVVHRLAGSGKTKGIADYCFQWCFDQQDNIRVDTHRDNKVMQNLFLRNGFRECGIIYLLNGSERIAFQRESTNRV